MLLDGLSPLTMALIPTPFPADFEPRPNQPRDSSGVPDGDVHRYAAALIPRRATPACPHLARGILGDAWFGTLSGRHGDGEMAFV